jgi:16S rRNA (uracil1498-N3)-methyltransferase
VRLVIGPEGGWDASEVATLRARGGHVVELGPHILRAETAALLAVGLAARARGTRSGG